MRRVAVGLEQAMHMHDEIAHLRVVDGALRLRLPGRVGGRIVRIDADDVELVEILEFDAGDALLLDAELQMKKLVGAVRHGDRSACPRVRVLRGVHP